MSDVLFAEPSYYWGLAIGIYLFLGGLAGGSYVTGFASDVLAYRNGETKPAHRQSTRWGFLIAVVAIAVGGPILLLHLGAPLRAPLILYEFTNWASWMAIGVWVLLLFTLFALVQFVWTSFGRMASDDLSCFVRTILAKIKLAGIVDSIADRTRPSERIRVGLNAVGAALAILLVVYTALLLSAIWVVPLWEPPLLPLLFLASGLSMGIAATMGLTLLSADLETAPIHEFSLADDVVIIAELVVIALLWQQLAAMDTPAAEMTIQALQTDYQLAFFGVVIGIGLIAPLVISVALIALKRVREKSEVHRILQFGYGAKFGFVVLGGLALRLVVLFAAVQEPIIL